MPALPQTTAEDLLRAGEAAHILGPDASTEEVARFLGGAAGRAQPALEAACKLGLLGQGTDSNHWNGNPKGRMLAHATQAQKTLLLRYELEGYGPYSLFRNRIVAGESPENAARQVCVTFDLEDDAHEVERTLRDWGTYSRGLSYAEDQSLLATVDKDLFRRVLEIHEVLLDQRAAVQAHILDRLGPEAGGFLTGEALERLEDAYLDLVKERPADQSTFQLGKGVEVFLKKLARRAPALTVPAATKTMGQYAYFLKEEGRLKEKHFQVIMGLVGIRNAADHAGDPEISNASWEISRELAFAANHMAWAVVKSVFAVEDGNFTL